MILIESKWNLNVVYSSVFRVVDTILIESKWNLNSLHPPTL